MRVRGHGSVGFMDELDPRVRAVCDLTVAEAREYGGRHEYDGLPQDLSHDGVAAGLARLAEARERGPAQGGTAQDDPHDEAHLRAFEDLQRVVYGDLELHRRNPMFHLGELDLACYDKDYAPQAERDAAKAAHLAAWPAVIDAAIGSLDAVPAPVAASLLGGITGLAAGIPADADPRDRDAALAAHRRLVSHVEQAALSGPRETALGAAALAALLGTAEATDVDLGALAARADAERDRLRARLEESAGRIDAKRPALDVARELVRDHPDSGGGARGGAVLDGAGDRVHPRTGPHAGQRRSLPGRRGPRVATLGDGDDLHQRARRAGRAVLVLDHAARGELARGGDRGVA